VKKDRNCGANMYPIYPMATPQMMVPGIPGMMQAMPNQVMNTQTTYASGSLEQQVNNMANQISNLERRVSNLEGLVGNTSYNTSNFQMM
jgi:hypothetical protein